MKSLIKLPALLWAATSILWGCSDSNTPPADTTGPGATAQFGSDMVEAADVEAELAWSLTANYKMPATSWADAAVTITSGLPLYFTPVPATGSTAAPAACVASVVNMASQTITYTLDNCVGQMGVNIASANITVNAVANTDSGFTFFQTAQNVIVNTPIGQGRHSFMSNVIFVMTDKIRTERISTTDGTGSTARGVPYLRSGSSATSWNLDSGFFGMSGLWTTNNTATNQAFSMDTANYNRPGGGQCPISGTAIQRNSSTLTTTTILYAQGLNTPSWIFDDTLGMRTEGTLLLSCMP